MNILSLPGAFFVGFLGSVHCISMCGAIAGALVFSLDSEVRTNQHRFFLYLLAYNLGRITSYATLGAIFGALGAGLMDILGMPEGHHFLRIAAAFLMIATGLHLGDWFPALAYIETLGIPLWRWIEPQGRRLLPVRSLMQALLFGIIWGWLPCSLVYAALAWAATANGALHGAGMMVAFGLGTLPTIAGTGWVAGWLLEWVRQPGIRKFAAAVIIFIAIIILWLPDTFYHNSHFHHF